MFSHIVPFLLEETVDLLKRHSFPTRRSSDLQSSPVSAIRCRAQSTGRKTRVHGNVRPPIDAIRMNIAVDRSEEHTSELQSPYDLVCRLLLEKKKIFHTTPSACTLIVNVYDLT